MSARGSVLDSIDAVYTCRDIEVWPEVVLAELRRLVPCDFAAFNDFDPETNRYVAVGAPFAMPPAWDKVWVEFGHQNPTYRRLVEEHDVGPMRLSDFIDQRQLHATELHKRLYGPMGINYQIGTALEAPQPQITAIVLNREKRDFTKSEVETVRLIRPHLRRSYDTARAFSGFARDRDRLEEAIAAAGICLVELAPDGTVLEATVAARALLERHRLATLGGTALAGDLGHWLEQTRPLDQLATTTFRTPAGVLGAALVPGPRAAQLLLDERFDRSSTTLPLTVREREVLETIADGTTNAQAAEALGVGERTIAKHLENIYGKLGVPNRGAALALYRARSGKG